MTTIKTLIADFAAKQSPSSDDFVSFFVGILDACKKYENRNVLSSCNFKLMRTFYQKTKEATKKDEILELLSKIRKEIEMPESYSFLSDSEVEVERKKEFDEMFNKIRLIPWEETVEELMNNFLSDPDGNYTIDSLGKIHEFVMKIEHPEKVTLKRRKIWTREKDGTSSCCSFRNWADTLSKNTYNYNKAWDMRREIAKKLDLVDDYRIVLFLRDPFLPEFRKIHSYLMSLGNLEEVTLEKKDWKVCGPISNWITSLPSGDSAEASKLIGDIRTKFFSFHQEIETRMNQFFLDGSFSSSEFNGIHELVMKHEKAKWISLCPSAKMIWGNNILRMSKSFLQQIEIIPNAKKLDEILDKFGRKFFEVTKEEELRFRMDYYHVPGLFQNFQNLKRINELVSSFEGQLPLISLDGWRIGGKVENVFLSSPQHHDEALSYLKNIRQKFGLEKLKRTKKEIKTHNDQKPYISYFLLETGEKDGPYLEYWPHTDIVRLEGYLSNGKKEGTWFTRNKKGIIISVQDFKDDLKDGDEFLYDDEGNLKLFYQFKGGVLNGLVRTFDEPVFIGFMVDGKKKVNLSACCNSKDCAHGDYV
jgi:hypothetical protein